MSRSQFSEMSAYIPYGVDLRAEAEAALREAVATRRRAGLKNEHAIEDAANWFGMLPRRVRMWLYDEIINPPVDQCARIIQRWWDDRESEITQARINLERMERELDQHRARWSQFELPLGSANEKSRRGFGRAYANAMASVARHQERAAEAEARYRRARS